MTNANTNTHSNDLGYTFDDLCVEFERECHARNLPAHGDADEILYSLRVSEICDPNKSYADDIAYITDFIRRWEALEELR